MSTSTLVKRSALTAGAVSMIGMSSIFGGASPSHAAIINGDFSTGNFTGWQTIGNTSVIDNHAVISNSSSISSSSIESFLGLQPGSLNAVGNGNVTTGSAIKQPFAAQAGDVLSFDWKFGTNDYFPFNDFSFVSIVSSVTKLADVVSLKGTAFNTNFAETPFTTFSFTIPTTDTYTLGLGAVNVTDSAVESTLRVNNVKLTPVPEPASVIGLLAFGAFGAGSSMLKRKQPQKATAKV